MTKRLVQAVSDVSLTIGARETLGLVGESGSGKSTLGRCVLQLLEPSAGSVKYNGVELVGMSREDLRPLRKEIQMIFQDPYSSLNPRHTVGTIIGIPLRVHKIVPEGKVLDRVRELVVKKVDGEPVSTSVRRDDLLEAGLTPGYRGLTLRRA